MGSDLKWIPDCDIGMTREYWRVFRASSGRAFMMPRPDGDRRVVEACAGTSPTKELLVKVAACEPVDVDRVNSMDPADAARVSRFLHEQLRLSGFVATEATVDPHPFPDDIAAACQALSPDQWGAMANRCGEYVERANNGFQPSTEEGVNFTPAEAGQLASMLNRLYGVPQK